MRSAERLCDTAIFLGLVSLKKPCYRSSASLSRVTRCDQRFGEAFLVAAFFRAEFAFRAVVFAVFLRAMLRGVVLRVRTVF